jgi:3-deoxy-7-phosphoheptulonate synthase
MKDLLIFSIRSSGSWTLCRTIEYYKEYEEMVSSINKAIKFMDTITPNRLNTTHKVDLYTSHEALNLFYDAAQTRRVPRKQGWFNLSAHLVWLGNRTSN